MTEADIADRLVAFVTEAAAARLQAVIKDFPGAKPPHGAYATASVLATWPIREGYLIDYRIEGDGQARAVTGIFEDTTAWKCSIDIHASEPTTIAGDLILALRAPFWLQKLGLLAVRETGPVTRLPVEVGGRWEGRANFTVTLVGTVRRERPIHEIETITIRPLRDEFSEGPGINLTTER